MLYRTLLFCCAVLPALPCAAQPDFFEAKTDHVWRNPAAFLSREDKLVQLNIAERLPFRFRGSSWDFSEGIRADVNIFPLHAFAGLAYAVSGSGKTLQQRSTAQLCYRMGDFAGTEFRIGIAVTDLRVRTARSTPEPMLYSGPVDHRSDIVRDGHTLDVGIGAAFMLDRWLVAEAAVTHLYTPSLARNGQEGPDTLRFHPELHAHLATGISFGEKWTICPDLYWKDALHHPAPEGQLLGGYGTWSFGFGYPWVLIFGKDFNGRSVRFTLGKPTGRFGFGLSFFGGRSGRARLKRSPVHEDVRLFF